MRTTQQIAASTIQVILASGEAWRYFVNGPDQTTRFNELADTGYIAQQLHTLSLLPQLTETKLSRELLFRLTHNQLTLENKDVPLAIDEEDSDSHHQLAYLQRVVEHFDARMNEAQRVEQKKRIATELTTIAKLCQRLSQAPLSFNPMALYLVCLQNNYPLPLIDDWSIFQTGTLTEIHAAIQHGMERTEPLLGGEAISTYFVHDADQYAAYSETCKSLAEQLGHDYRVSFINSAKLRYLHAAKLNDLETAAALDAQIDDAIGLLGRAAHADEIYQIKIPALLEAAQYGHTEFIMMTLDISDIDMTNMHLHGGKTLLHAAAECEQSDTVTYLLSRGANPYIMHNGMTVFNYALQFALSDMQLAKDMLAQHIADPAVDLGEVEEITNPAIQKRIEHEFALPALERGDIKTLAFCVDHGFIFNESTYRRMLDLLAQPSNESGLADATRLQLFNLLPEYFEYSVERRTYTTAKYTYFVSQVNTDDLLIFPHLSMTPTPTNTASFRQCSQMFHHGLLKLAQQADMERLRAFIMSAFSTATTDSQMPKQYVATLLKGAIESTDDSILYTLVNDGNIAALQVYFDIVLNSDAVTVKQIFDILRAPKLFGAPPKKVHLFDILLTNNNADALYTYTFAVLNSSLAFGQKLRLLCANNPDIGNPIEHLAERQDGDKLAAMTRAIYKANLTDAQRDQMLHQHVEQYGGIVRSLFDSKLVNNHQNLLLRSHEDAEEKVKQASQAQLADEAAQQALTEAQATAEQATTELAEAKRRFETAKINIAKAISQAQQATHQSEALQNPEEDKEVAEAIADAMWDAVDEANAAEPKAEEHYHIKVIELSGAQRQLEETEKEARLTEESLQKAQAREAKAAEDIEDIAQLTNTATLLSAQQLAEFVSQTLACDTLDTEQKYRLIWPKGSSKEHGLCELFKPEANKPDHVRAYLKALLTSSLDEEVKSKIVRRVTEHMTLPIEGGRFSIDNLVLDLALLGYQYKDQYKTGIFRSKPKPEAHVAMTLAYIYRQPMLSNHTQPATIVAIISSKVRELYLDEQFNQPGRRNTPFMRTLAAIAQGHSIAITPDLPPIATADRSTPTIEADTSTAVEDSPVLTVSGPIPIPRKQQRFFTSAKASVTHQVGMSFASSTAFGRSVPGTSLTPSLTKFTFGREQRVFSDDTEEEAQLEQRETHLITTGPQ